MFYPHLISILRWFSLPHKMIPLSTSNMSYILNQQFKEYRLYKFITGNHLMSFFMLIIKQLESKDSENFQTHGSKESEYLQVTTKLGSELSANFLLLSAPPVFRPLVPHPHSRSWLLILLGNPALLQSSLTWPTHPTPPCSDKGCHRCVTALALWTSPPEGHPMGALWMVGSVTLFHSWSTKWTLQSSLN